MDVTVSQAGPCGCGGSTSCACRKKAADGHPARPSRVPAGAAAAVVSRPGQPLPVAVRSRFEGAFGADLSDVRVHADSLAAQASDELDAHAWTAGHHVALAAGRWAPDTPAGDRLLAHELTHVLQHRQAALDPRGAGDDGAAEEQADRTADQVVAGGRATAPTARPAGISLQRRGGGVTRVDVNCADQTIHFNGPNAHTWQLSECDLSDGDYDATVEIQWSPITVVRFKLRNAPEGTRFRFSYRIMGREPDPIDLVRGGQSVKIHATSAPAARGKAGTGGGAQGGAGSALTFHVAVVDAATYQALSGHGADTLTPGQLGPGFAVPTPEAGFGLLFAQPYSPTLTDPFAGTFGEQWARGGAAAYEAAARAQAAATGSFVPSWAVDPAAQEAWHGLRLGGLTPTEMDLVQDVLNAPDVLIGRSTNIRGQGGFVLDDWLAAWNMKWGQRWQDVYNRALYARTSIGIPARVLSGAGYTAGEVGAAEAGARAGGILNEPFWPVGGGKLPPPTLSERLRLAGLPPGAIVTGAIRAGGVVLLVYGAYQSATRIAEAPEGQRMIVAAQEGGSWLGGWVGAVLSSAFAGAVVCAETGPGALICSIGFGLAGGKTGSTVGAHVAGRAAVGLQQVGELLSDPARLSEAAVQMFGTDEERRRFYEDQEILRSAGF
jgi:hypothetical protein